MGTDDTGIAHVIEGDVVRLPSGREEIDFPGDEWFFAISYIVTLRHKGQRYELTHYAAAGFDKAASQASAQQKADEVNAKPIDLEEWERIPGFEERMQNEYMREQSDHFEDW